MYTRGLICYRENNLIFCFNKISAANSGASKTICRMALLVFVLKLRLKWFIIYVYLQQFILNKIWGNNWGLNKYYHD